MGSSLGCHKGYQILKVQVKIALTLVQRFAFVLVLSFILLFFAIQVHQSPVQYKNTLEDIYFIRPYLESLDVNGRTIYTYAGKRFGHRIWRERRIFSICFHRSKIRRISTPYRILVAR